MLVSLKGKGVSETFTFLLIELLIYTDFKVKMRYSSFHWKSYRALIIILFIIGFWLVLIGVKFVVQFVIRVIILHIDNFGSSNLNNLLIVVVNYCV